MSLDWETLPIPLELEDVLWAPDRASFTARADVHALRFARKRKRITLEVTLNRPAPFETVAPFDAHPKGRRIFSGFPDFDREVWVTATDWNAEATDHVLASEATRQGLLALIHLGGAATSTRLMITLDGPNFDAVKATLHAMRALATTLALSPHERTARPARRRANRIDETSETAVDEWAKDRFRLSNPFVTPSTFEVDLKAGTLQVPPSAPMRFGVYFVRPKPELGKSTLECQGRPGALCTGRHKSIESLADALARLGVDVLA